MCWPHTDHNLASFVSPFYEARSIKLYVATLPLHIRTLFTVAMCPPSVVTILHHRIHHVLFVHFLPGCQPIETVRMPKTPMHPSVSLN